MSRRRTFAFALALGGLCLALSPGAGRAAEAPKPLRVLVAAGGPTRDFQFLRSLWTRETDAKKVDLTFFVQPPGGKPVAATETLPRVVAHFPDHLKAPDPAEKDEVRPYNYTSYDVIVAFDVDWTALDGEQRDLLKEWVNQGGGLVLVAGPINTLHLARKGAADKLKPILDLYPVTLSDSRDAEERDAAKPGRLALHDVKGERPFLKLDSAGKGPLAGWSEFFYGDADEHKELVRGFYSCYPVKEAKAGAVVLAGFKDPSRKEKDAVEVPYIVEAEAGKGRVVYLGSGETWRLRQYKASFHARFWNQLLRYAAGIPEEKEPEQTPEDLSLEIQALRTLYRFQLTADQMRDVQKTAKETAGPGRERGKGKVSDEYRQAMTDLRDALAKADNDEQIDEREDKFAELDDKESPDLNDAFELTAAARKQAPDLFRRLKPSQLADYIRAADPAEVIDPFDRLTDALAKVRGLKRDEWKEERDALAELVGAAVAGVDADKAGRVSDQVVALLSKARGLTDEEFKAQQADLQKTADAIAGAVGPDEVLRHTAEHALAALLSNPRLEAALQARLK